MPLSPTQKAYKAINDSPSITEKLGKIYSDWGREAWGRVLEEECNRLEYSAHINISSLKSNLYRYGKWRKHLETDDFNRAFHLIDGNMNYRRATHDIYNDCKIGVYKKRAKLGVAVNKWLKELDIRLPPHARIELKKKLEKEGNWKHYKKDAERLYNEMDITPGPVQVVHDEQQWPNSLLRNLDFSDIEVRAMAMLNSIAPKEKDSMCKVEIKKQTLINGNPVEEMGDSDLIHWITNLEDTIEKRKKIKTKSVKITNDIAKMEAQCVELAALLDERDNGD